MKETVWLTCDECSALFEVELGIAIALWAFEEEGDPICCEGCCPSDPYAEDE